MSFEQSLVQFTSYSEVRLRQLLMDERHTTEGGKTWKHFAQVS